MSISRLHPLLVLFLSLSAAPAFSVEEIKAGVAIPNDATMTKAEAGDMIKSGNSGTEAVASISSPADGSTNGVKRTVLCLDLGISSRQRATLH